MGKIGAFELILILAVVLLLFGGKKIPELMRGMGKGIRNFKESIKGGEDEIIKEGEEDSKPGSTSEKK